MQRGRYAWGEGVTGRVMVTGQPEVIADVRKHPEFLNRTDSRSIRDKDDGHNQAISFICVPVKDGDQYVGAISADKPLVNEASIEADTRLLTIIAGSFAQTIRLHHQAQIQTDRLLAENQQLRDNLHSKYRFDNIIGSSPAVLDVLAIIAQVASS